MRLLSLTAALLTVVAALPRARPLNRRGSEPLPPTVDPFYVPPANWLDAKPGDVLKWRTITPGFTQLNHMNVDKAYQILYRSNGINNDVPMTTVTTVLVPHNAHKNSLVLMMPYQDSNYIGCSPSYIIQQGAPIQNNSIQSLEQLLWTSVLNDGWIMSIPDHEGPNASFAVGPMAGRASLDAARATLNFDKLGLAQNSPIVGTGYSGGAIAAGWAAQLHSTYAKELNVAGWALGGTPSNMSELTYTLDGGLFSGFAVAGLAGVVNSYSIAQDYIGTVVTHAGNVAMQYTREHCMSDIVINLRNTHVLNKTFATTGSKLLLSDQITPLLNEISMARDKALTPIAPVYMYHALHDEVISFDSANATAHAWCANGAKVHLQSFFGLEMGHITTELLNTPNVLSFIRNRFANKDFGDCSFTSSPDPLWSPDILGAKLTEVFNAVMNFWGFAIGRGDATLKENIQQGKPV
ncbi:hypothetical protein MCUN1_000984 [Malassezia cuniculi]|uniref:triacylglycerol lipase n=1 Tax=Malassezia cuniculi TaxID=948313 RepID=A0AAF0EWV1_9BASI|nr:hypothetical protein MCUN1_000984 [Malassezia cuniculi]